MADDEIYASYARFAATVAEIKPEPFEKWATERDALNRQDLVAREFDERTDTC